MNPLLFWLCLSGSFAFGWILCSLVRRSRGSDYEEGWNDALASASDYLTAVSPPPIVPIARTIKISPRPGQTKEGR